jgi:hypothetical protein
MAPTASLGKFVWVENIRNHLKFRRCLLSRLAVKLNGLRTARSVRNRPSLASSGDDFGLIVVIIISSGAEPAGL